MKKTSILILSVLVLLIGEFIISCSSSGVDDLAKTLESISITSPTSLFCWLNENLNTKDLVVKATYDDGSSVEVTGWTTSSDTFTTGTNTITISYTENGITKTATIDVDVQDKNDWIMKRGVVDPDNIPESGDEWFDWFKEFGIDWTDNDGNNTVKEIEFVKQTPQSFEVGKTKGTDYTTKCDLTSNTNGNIMGYCNNDVSKIWIVGEHFFGNPDCYKMFYAFLSLTTMTNINFFDTSYVTTMSNMFSYSKELTTLDLSSFNTSNVTDMSSLFSDCPKLTSLNLSGWDTSNVITMEKMFGSCTNLQILDLSSFDISTSGLRNNLVTTNMLSSEITKLYLDQNQESLWTQVWPHSLTNNDTGTDSNGYYFQFGNS